MIKNYFTEDRQTAEIIRQSLRGKRINFIETKEDQVYRFRPTRIHRKRFHKHMIEARGTMIRAGYSILDVIEG